MEIHIEIHVKIYMQIQPHIFNRERAWLLRAIHQTTGLLCYRIIAAPGIWEVGKSPIDQIKASLYKRGRE